MFNNRLSFFMGHFGSGKTEVSVNYAIRLKGKNDNICLLDFDIVNPYFRAADAKKHLNSNGIDVIIPMYANTNVDIPALGSDIGRVFADKKLYGVFDVGGDDLGANAVSRYKCEIEKDDYALYVVVNTRRPLTDSPEKVVTMFHEITESAGLTPIGLVNNTNVLDHTTIQDIAEGGRIISEASEMLNCPIIFTSVMENINGEDSNQHLCELLHESGISGDILVMQKLIHLPF